MVEIDFQLNMEGLFMKQLVYGGILMITGMLGVIAAILTLSAVSYTHLIIN